MSWSIYIWNLGVLFSFFSFPSVLRCSSFLFYSVLLDTLSAGSRNDTIMHWSVCNLNIPPGIWIFRFLAVKFPPTSSKKPFKCLTCKTRWMPGQTPHPWGMLFTVWLGKIVSKQLCYKFQLAFFILKFDERMKLYRGCHIDSWYE